MYGDDEFFMDDNELNAETQISMADQQKIKVLENMKKKIDEAISNLTYSEKEEYSANFAIISRYVGAVIDIEGMEDDPEISEEQLLEEIEKIEITVKELSFQDLRDIEKKNNIIEVDDDDDDSSNHQNIDDDFDF